MLNKTNFMYGGRQQRYVFSLLPSTIFLHAVSAAAETACTFLTRACIQGGQGKARCIFFEYCDEKMNFTKRRKEKRGTVPDKKCNTFLGRLFGFTIKMAQNITPKMA